MQREVRVGLKRLIAAALALLCVLSGTGQANACVVTVHRTDTALDFSARMRAEHGKACRSLAIDASGSVVNGGGILEEPKHGKVSVLPDPGYEYLGSEIGPDAFAIAFYGLARGRSVRITYRVTVEVIASSN